MKNQRIYTYICDCIAGNGQRNYASTKITNPDTLLYYLDDDNIIHPDLYNLLDFVDNNIIYTFNQYYRIKINNIIWLYYIYIYIHIPFSLC